MRSSAHPTDTDRPARRSDQEMRDVTDRERVIRQYLDGIRTFEDMLLKLLELRLQGA
jgi:hypothetical protein